MGTDMQPDPNIATDNIEAHRVLILPALASTQDEIAVTIRLGLTTRINAPASTPSGIVQQKR